MTSRFGIFINTINNKNLKYENNTIEKEKKEK